MTNELVKTCKKHGELKKENIYFRNDGKANECKLCRYDRHAKWILNNIEKSKKSQKAWRDKNKEKLKEKMKKWTNSEKGKKYHKNYIRKNTVNIKCIAKKSRDKFRKIIQSKKKDSVKNLTDSYIKSLICNNSSLKTKDIPQELINIKKIHLKIKRKLKETINDNK